jgi:hypothetical protein
MNDATDEQDLEAGRRERQFDAMVQLFCKRYQVNEDEIPHLIETVRWSRQHRSGISKLHWSAALGVLAAVVTGLLLMIWEGIKHTVTHPGP